MIYTPGSQDISPQFTPDATDNKIIKKILKYEETPVAIKIFDKYKDKLSDYGYWFILSTLWVSYTGYSDIRVWRKLFSSARPHRSVNIMKPSELETLKSLPEMVDVYRAKRPGETDWLAYTLSPEIAGVMAVKRGITVVHHYTMKKSDILCLLLRRGEQEVLCLKKEAPTLLRTMEVVRGTAM